MSSMIGINAKEKSSTFSYIGADKEYFESKVVNIFLSISLNMCFGCSIELSHRDSSFEYLNTCLG